MGQFVEVAPYEPQVGMTEVDSPSLLFDRDSNRFDGIRVHDRNNGNINWYLVTMTAPDGRALRAWEVRRPPWKLSNGTFFWSGNDLIVMLTGYELVPKPRPNGRDFTRIPGVFNAGRLMEEAGGAGGWVGNAEEGGGGGMTEEDMRRVLREEAPALVEQINVRLLRRGGQGGDGAATKTIDNIRPKVAAELDEKRVLTVDNVDDATHQFFMDRVYQTFADNVLGFWAWLDNKVNGESAIPTPPPPIEPIELVEPTEPTEGGTP